MAEEFKIGGKARRESNHQTIVAVKAVTDDGFLWVREGEGETPFTIRAEYWEPVPDTLMVEMPREDVVSLANLDRNFYWNPATLKASDCCKSALEKENL